MAENANSIIERKKTMAKHIVTKEEIIEAAHSASYGGFLRYSSENTDWLDPRDAKEFKSYIESKGFKVISCKPEGGSSGVARTEDGYSFAMNGHCSRCRDSMNN